jgi:hypothetical protein
MTGNPSNEIEHASSRRFRLPKATGFKGDFRQWEDLLRVAE